ncbi:hypothetical protein [Fulvivirga sp.]|uniref:hypothetical protein n=1 Tax=Fulvivirga sp. TaxID=1931237 RepID=UPI0032ED5EB5
MKLLRIHSYLVDAGKGLVDQPFIKGTELTGNTSKMYKMLENIFLSSLSECKYDIAFNRGEDGLQNNKTRSIILDYVNQNSLDNGREIAKRLQEVTTGRSGLGLLFIIYGENNTKKRVVISRFAANTGVLADEQSGTITIEYVERVFMKSDKAYKAAVYEDSDAKGGFWNGKAVDKQINNDLQISEYWINEFLQSDFRTTGTRGTRYLSNSLKKAISSAESVEIKEELSAVVNLLRGFDGKTFSASSLLKRLSVSDEATEILKNNYQKDAFDLQFQLNYNDLSRPLAYKTIELNNGARLSATNDEFDKVFKKTNLENNKVEYSTKGEVKNQKLGRGK